ncbi:MAG TPA: hypothetical protein VLX59_01875, partial [Acidimicrobiales bacterium]|nr:hypothetical protein [Acidimicrobiales bacterium]
SDWHATLVGTTGATTVVADGEPGRPYVLAEGPGGWSEPSSDPRVFGAVQTVARPADAQSTGSRLGLAVDLFTPPQTIGGRSWRTTEVLSTDGSAWTAGADASPAVLPPSRPAGATETVRFASEWVAIGEAEPAAAPVGSINPTGLAESWTSADGVHWIPRGPLDAAAGVGPEQPTGLCVQSGSNPRVIAVGWSYQATAGQVALAWVSADGAHWSRALIGPSALPSGAQEISGCIVTTTGLVAYGATTAGSGATIPAIWRSTDGSAWTREATPTFVPESTAEVTSLASAGSTWIAVVSEPGWTGGTKPTGSDESASASQLWVSEDGGVTWLSLDTSGPPWQSGDAAKLVLAAFAGDRPVLAGVVAGQLAVWVGSPATQPLSSSAST